MKIAIGMDLHAKSAVCYAVYAGEGEPKEKQIEFLEDFNLKHRIQGSEPEDMAKIAKSLAGHEAYVLIENSTKSYETYWVLTNLGVNVVVAQAIDLFRITKSVKKTDKNDSEELAAYMRRRLHGEREFAVCVMPPKDWMMKREICRTLFREKAHLGDLKRRVRAHLLLHGIKLSREYSDIFCARAMRELRETKDLCILMMTSEAADIKARSLEEGKIIEHLFKDIRMYELIHSIPGFGLVTAAYLTAMIMDLDRFRSCKMFTAYFGIVPRVRDSADTVHHTTTTHRGDEEIRRLLEQAAFVHANTVDDSVVKRMWERLKSKGKAHREVQIACARKLLTVVWAVVKNDRPYTENEEQLRLSARLAEEMLEEPSEE